MPLAEYQTVQIKALLQDVDTYDPFGINDGSPRVGDTGTIVYVEALEADEPIYTVERCRPDGTCIWLAKFAEQELGSVEETPPPPETDFETPSEPPPASEGHDTSEDVGDETLGVGWRMYAGMGFVVVLGFALLVAGLAAVFLLWPPDSAWGAGFRAAAVIAILTFAAGVLVDEKLVDLLITTTIITVVSFVLGAAIWYQWTGVGG